MALASMLLGIFERPTLWEVLIDLLIVAVPLWIAVAVGVVVGWSWRPRWANFTRNLCIPSFVSIPGFGSLKPQFPGFLTFNSLNGLEEQTSLEKPNSSSNKLSCVEEADLRHLKQLVEVKDGGPAWIPMMDRSTPTMSYQAWRRDLQNGPPQYRSRTVFEDATPEMVRDFFWDDEFRFKWDEMLIQHKTLEECSITGTMIVHWVRKFPFFCSDREYVIGRRIWESNRSYYCVTKGVPYSSVPRRSKPRRVDVYYSSWCIRPGAYEERFNLRARGIRSGSGGQGSSSRTQASRSKPEEEEDDEGYNSTNELDEDVDVCLAQDEEEDDDLDLD